MIIGIRQNAYHPRKHNPMEEVSKSTDTMCLMITSITDRPRTWNSFKKKAETEAERGEEIEEEEEGGGGRRRRKRRLTTSTVTMVIVIKTGRVLTT